MYTINDNTHYEYTFEAKNNRVSGYTGVIFAYDVAAKLPYFAYGEFDNNSDKGSCIHIRYRKGHFDTDTYSAAVNNDDVTAVVKQTSDGYGQFKVIYEGYKVKFCYLGSNGEYVQLGSTITLPQGSKVCVGVFSREGNSASKRTVSLRNCVITAKNDATVDYLEGENVSLVKTFNLKIGSYNICKAQHTNWDLTKMANVIKNAGLDIVGFQEVDNKTKRTNYSEQIKVLSQKTGLKYYKFFKAFDFNGGGFGVAILSRYPIVDSDITYLPSGNCEQRILARAGIRVNNEIINFFVTHLSYNGEGISRANQFTTIANKISKYNNVILTGDFNTESWKEFDPIVNKGMQLLNNSTKKVTTYVDETYGGLALDNIIWQKSMFTAGAASTVKDSGSDHYMLYATFRYKE